MCKRDVEKGKSGRRKKSWERRVRREWERVEGRGTKGRIGKERCNK